jgi:hypothetical protein
MLSMSDHRYEFVGEASYPDSLNGEILLDMMGENLKRPRPSPLHEMDKEFSLVSLI